jgi:putative oxidoreductase
MTDRYSSEALGALRIMSAALFICNGTSKLFAWPVRHAAGKVEVSSLLGVAGAIEIVGGLLLLLGLLARPIALILAGEMAFAYFMAHAIHGFWPIANGGQSALLFCFAFLALAANGPGAWSMDGKS